jgi:small-conductance mechanosensitive channel/CRP-like cAMP-binding protein
MASTNPFWPLLLTTLLLFASFVLPRLRAHWPLWTRVVAQLVLFAVLTALVQRILGSPLEPHYTDTSTGVRFWQQLIEASWWIITARLSTGLVRLMIVLESGTRETRFVSDLLVGVIVIATCLAIINFAFQVPIGALLATSGVIAIVLGLALQNTLSDVFSGIAVGIERPYAPGDSIWVEGGVEGQVVQVNWRSTHIATYDHNIAVIPNSVMAKARLINRSQPTAVRSASVTIALNSSAVPERCRETLIAALRSCCLILDKPTSWIACTEVKGDGVTWDIGFSVERADVLLSAKTEVLWQIHRHLRHAGIALAVSGSADPAPATVPNLKELLEASDLFRQFSGESCGAIAEHFKFVRLHAGDTLIRAGDDPEQMFMLTSGTAEITIVDLAGPRVIYRISPGETLGAVGLVTGTRHKVTATALTEMTAYCLDKSGLSQATDAHPNLKEMMVDAATHVRFSGYPEAVVAGKSDASKRDIFRDRLNAFLQALES